MIDSGFSIDVGLEVYALRRIEPDYIVDAWEQVNPYIERNGTETQIRDDAPEYIKDAFIALTRRAKWMDEYEIWLMSKDKCDN